MSQPRGSEVLLDLGEHAAGVTHGQPGQQPGLRIGQHRRRRAQAGAQRAGTGLPPRWGLDLVWLAAHPQDCHREIVPGRRREHPVGGDHLTGQQLAPDLGGREQQHPPAELPAVVPDLRSQEPGPHEHLGGPAGPCAVDLDPQRPRVVGEHDPQRRRGTPVGGGLQRVRADEHQVHRDHQPGGQCTRRRRLCAAGPASSSGAQGRSQRRHCDQPHNRDGDQAAAQTGQRHHPYGRRRRDQPQVRWVCRRGSLGLDHAAGQVRAAITGRMPACGPGHWWTLFVGTGKVLGVGIR